MTIRKIYLTEEQVANYDPNGLEFFFDRDENGWYETERVWDSPEEERAANKRAWSEYWSQFTQDEIYAMQF